MAKMGSTVIRDQYRAVNKKLLTSPLPVKFIESRDYAADHNSVTFVGLWNRKQDEMEEGFPISGKIDLTKENIGVIPWKCTVYKKGTNQREIESGVFLTINGQEHGNLDQPLYKPSKICSPAGLFNYRFRFQQYK